MHCEQESLYHEIIIPKNLMMFRGLEERAEKVSYVLRIRGKWHVINLKQKRGLFVKNFPVYTHQNGKLGLDMPFIQDDCFYDGHLEGDSDSLVTVSTCSGLQGILNLHGTVFGIKPMYASNKFEHMVYSMSLHSGMSCSVRADEREELLTNKLQSSLEPSSVPMWSQPKYIEMFIVVDKKRFQMWNNNVTKTTQTVMDVHALVNRYMRELNVKVVLTGLEIWTEENLVQISLNLQETLQNFNQWRDWHLLRRVKHDVAHMITGQNTAKYQGHAFLSGICTDKYATSVESFSDEDIPYLAALMAHELGHNLGMKHDHATCKCKSQQHLCTMHEFITMDTGFSNCSFHYFYQLLQRHRGDCLFNKPQLQSSSGKSYCGNKIVDDGEECDCGSALDCQKDRCCLPSCHLKRGSDCAFGSCCKSCKFLKATTLCRPSVNECDLPEYCNGTSQWCHTDTYKQDGTPCQEQGYCYLGQCRSLENECVKIFGQGSRVAQENCYHYMNTQGDRFGNCGSESKGVFKVFRKCRARDVKCGRLLCENIQRLPHIGKRHTLIQFPLKDTWCWGTEHFEAISGADEGEVKDGTPCGPQKVCINRTCLDIAALHYDCNLERCHGRGVCNNFKNCHCAYGYAPPVCELEGYGGSLNSGPAPRISSGSQYSNVLKILIWLCPIFLLVLVSAIFLLVYLYRRSKIRVNAKNSSEQQDEQM
ncbi:disintegrin and metalloproteinase domain-containing protein 1-like [Tenrec ecaudatus]|uniref:disintegrin and metalloproteinase domain-containing protein 1-like n=1 Tax=Tenrec ecaudatus TaxID=94439 RepID=UPI003F59D8D0